MVKMPDREIFGEFDNMIDMSVEYKTEEGEDLRGQSPGRKVHQSISDVLAGGLDRQRAEGEFFPLTVLFRLYCLCRKGGQSICGLPRAKGRSSPCWRLT